MRHLMGALAALASVAAIMPVVAATAAVAPMPAVFKNSRLSIRNLLTTKTGYVRQLATPQKNTLHRLLP